MNLFFSIGYNPVLSLLFWYFHVSDLASGNPFKMISIPLNISSSFCKHFLALWHNKMFQTLLIVFPAPTLQSAIFPTSLAPLSGEWYLEVNYLDARSCCSVTAPRARDYLYVYPYTHLCPYFIPVVYRVEVMCSNQYLHFQYSTTGWGGALVFVTPFSDRQKSGSCYIYLFDQASLYNQSSIATIIPSSAQTLFLPHLGLVQ